MKTLVRLAVSTLFIVPTLPRLAAAQPAPGAPAPVPAAPDAAPPAPAPAPDAAPPAVAPAPPAPAMAPPTVPKGPEWTSLRLLHDKGVISDAELESALKDIGVMGAADATTFVLSKIKTTLYGYVEANYKYDSTENCVEFCSNTQIPKEHTYKGDHGRTIFSPRDSRIGIRIAAPEEHGIKVSGLLETDFFGPTTTSEQGLWSNPVLRIRNSYVKMETPVVDLLFGQTWSLFGWQPNYLLATVQLPGLQGQMFERTPQFKISKTIKSDAVSVELAVAANRPPQEDSSTPEGVAGARLLFNKWSGAHTGYMVSTNVIPASIAVSGDVRQFRFPDFAAVPGGSTTLTGGGVSFSAYLPIIPATKASKENALSLTGEFTIGKGTSDMYTAMGGAGTASAAIPSPVMGGAATPYPANFDAGFGVVDASGHAELIKWTTYAAGLEYYPGGVGGRLGIVLNYEHSESPNAKNVGTAALVPQTTAAAVTAAQAKIRDHEDFYEGGLFFDPTKQTRIALSGSLYNDAYADGKEAKNYSGLMSAWLFY